MEMTNLLDCAHLCRCLAAVCHDDCKASPRCRELKEYVCDLLEYADHLEKKDSELAAHYVKICEDILQNWDVECLKNPIERQSYECVMQNLKAAKRKYCNYVTSTV
jgi:hypothetical protein